LVWSTRRNNTASCCSKKSSRPQSSSLAMVSPSPTKTRKNLKKTSTSPSFPNPNAFSCTTEITTSPANYSSNRNSPTLWNVSPSIPTTSITAPWPASWPRPSTKAEAWLPPPTSPPTKSKSASPFAAPTGDTTSSALRRHPPAAWRDSIDPNHATPSKELKRPSFGELERVAQLPPTALREPQNTTHYSVVDADGNAVSVTTTLNDSFGSRVTAAGLGFLLNDEMDDFAAKQGVPNIYGLIQGPANAIGPGKRPLSAMTPTIVLKDGKLFLVLGSPGGPRIITIVANILIGVVDFSLDIQEAVNAPRFHHQWLPDQILVEDRLSPDTMNLLGSKGHKVKVDYSWGNWGDGECIMIDPKTGERL